MGRTLIGGTVTSPSVQTGTVDWKSRQTEGLPLRATWSHDGSGNQWYSCTVYDCLGNTVGGADGGKANSTTTYQFGNYADQNFSYSGDLASTYGTNGQLTTQANMGVYWVQANRCNTYLPMHAMLNVSPDGNFASTLGPSYSSQTLNTTFIYSMTQVLPQGRRPRKFITLANNTFRVTTSLLRMHFGGITDSLIWNTHPTVTGASWFAQYSNGNGYYTYAGSCYNERTNKLMITTQIGATTTQRSILLAGKKGVLLTDPKVSLSDWFDAATAVSWTEFNFQYNGGTSSETRYDQRTVLGDNDVAMVFQHQTSSTLFFQKIDWNSGQTGSHTVSNYSHSATGFSAGNSADYALRIQTTWSNKWMFVFTGTYQEGSGISGVLVSTEDPNRYFTFIDSFNFGGQVLPDGENGLFFARSENSDSSGLWGGALDFSQTSTTGTDATTYWAGTNTTALSVTSGSALLNNVSSQPANLPSGFYSTNYPAWITVNWWPRDGISSYQPL